LRNASFIELQFSQDLDTGDDGVMNALRQRQRGVEDAVDTIADAAFLGIWFNMDIGSMGLDRVTDDDGHNARNRRAIDIFGRHSFLIGFNGDDFLPFFLGFDFQGARDFLFELLILFEGFLVAGVRDQVVFHLQFFIGGQEIDRFESLQVRLDQGDFNRLAVI